MGSPARIALASVALAAAAVAPTHAATASRPGSTGPDHVQGELIVGYAPGASRADRLAVRRGNGATFGRRMLLPQTEVVEIDPALSEEEAAERIERDPRVRYAQPNRLRRLYAAPNDPRFGEMWGLHNTGQSVLGSLGTADADIDAPEAWDRTQGSSQVVVAVVDTGLAATHPDIAPNLWTNPAETANGMDDGDPGALVDDVHGWDFADDDADPTDTDGHGTHVAGTASAAGNNGLGVTGVSQQSKIMPLKVFPDGGNGAADADIADAFAYAGQHGAEVVNASLGGPGMDPATSEAIAASPGTLFVVAAGNDSQDNDSVGDYPCNYPYENLICVAATDQHDAFASFTNFGPTSVDLAAPGVSVLSTYPAYDTTWSEDFTADDFATRWTATGDWARVPDPRVGGSGHVMTDSPGVNYQGNRSAANNSARITGSVDLTGRTGCLLEFDSNINVEVPHDALRLQASDDGLVWQQVGAPYSYADGSPQDPNSWFTETASLAAYDGAPVHLRFLITSDPDGNTGDGAHIDDIAVKCLGTDFSSAYGFLNGTSMASPHVAGAAALVFSANPGAAVSFVRDALLTTVDPLPSALQRSRLVTGGRLNAAAAVGFDPEPPPTQPPPDTQTQQPAQTQAPAPQPTPAPAPSRDDTTLPRDLADALFGFPRRLHRVSGLGRLLGVEAWSPTRSTQVRARGSMVDPLLGLASDDRGTVRVLVRGSLATAGSTARSSGRARLVSQRISLASGRASRVRLRLSRSALKALRAARRGRLVIDLTVVDSSGRRTRASKVYTVYPPRSRR